MAPFDRSIRFAHAEIQITNVTSLFQIYALRLRRRQAECLCTIVFLRVSAILLFLALIPLTTCGKDSPTRSQAPEPTSPPPPPPAPVATRVEISPSSASLTSVGQTVQLSARVFDQNNAQMSSAVVTWTSSAVGVATVSGQGLVTAVKNGSATITARSGSASASIQVTVMQSVGSIAIEPSSATLMSLGETVQLTATVLDQNGQPVADAVVTWSSSDEAVATVSGQGLVTAVKKGTATITGRSGSASATTTVTVMQSVDSIAIGPSSVTLMSLGETVQLTATVLDQNGQPVADAVVTWSSSDEAVATVSGQGLVTAVKKGTATITGRSGSASATTTVTVMQSVDSIAIGPSSVTLMSLGETVQLTAKVLDQNGQPVADAAVSWSSSDEAVAKVSNQGLVTAAGNGMAIITARSGTASATSTVTVMDASRDREALIALYNSTNGSDWAVSTNWLSDAPLNTWHGVSTGTDGRVDRLDLYDNGLDGPLPPELGTLTGLATLELSSNRLVGIIPQELGELLQLRSLRLERNVLRGSIPQELSRLALLWRLDLSHNQITGPIPSELSRMARMSYLDLSGNQITGAIPPELGDLSNLQRLEIRHNQLTRSIPPELGSLAQLQYLDLAYNSLTGPIPVELSRLTRLWQLSLSHNQITDTIPSELGNLANLTGLFLHDNRLSGPIPSELGNLSNLDDLWLGSNQLSGPIPPELGNLSKLTYLLLGNGRLTGSVPAELGNLSNLVVLTLGDNLLEGSIPQSFLALNKLESFGCQETNGVCLPATYAFRAWARQVEARGNVDFPVDIPYCDEIDRHGLTTFYEATNGDGWAFSDGWLEEDGSLDQWYGVQTDSIGRVFSLDLSSNGLSGGVPEALGMLANMRTLRIGNNALTGRLPLSLSAVPLDEFDYAGTSLCVADDADLQSWLDGIRRHTGTGVRCAPLTEREILTSLYWSTGGPSWAYDEGWLDDSPLSAWYGVETNGAGLVVALRLRSNNLSGELPAELGQLPALRVLDLASNSLSGSIPPTLGDLERLEVLRLRNNSLSGVMSAELGRLSALRILHLDRNRLSGPIPSALGNLVQLEQLTLSNNQLSGQIPAELRQLGNLRYLDLGHNGLSGLIPPALGDLGRLEWLRLVQNQLSGSLPPELGQLVQLRELHLSFNDLSGPIPSVLGNLSNLVRLEMTGNHLDGPLPTHLGRIRPLKFLDLGGNELTGSIPPQLGDLAALEHLLVGNNELTGTIPAELGDLAVLIELDLSGNQLTGSLPVALGRAASLETLALQSNLLSGPVPSSIGNLTMLKQLILADNPGLAGRLPHGITALERLELLMAGGTDLCRPANARFDAWFRAIPNRRLVVCEGGAAVYLTQTVQSWDDPVPLLEGEPALLRVFVTGPQMDNATMPNVRATFYVNGAERHTVHIPSSTQTLPPVVDEGDLELSANAEIPEWLITPGLEMAIEIDPSGVLDPSLGVRMRIPEEGRMPVDVRALPPFHLTLVPFLLERDPDFSIVEAVESMAADPLGDELLRDVRTLLPVAEFDVSARETVVTSTPSPFRVLSQLDAIRLMEGGSGYWMGIFAKSQGNQAWPGGVAYADSPVSVAEPIPGTIAHELGHNLGLLHAPCRADGTDPWFPHLGGRIGVWGFDFEQDTLVPPSVPDVMSYCYLSSPYWISDFFFNKALNHRLNNEDGTVLAATQARTLLLWGGRNEDGVPYLDPAFVVDAVPSPPLESGDYVLEGFTADDEVLFSYSFDMPVNPDARGNETSFVFTLPVQRAWAGNLESITLSGPGGTAVLDETTNRAMAILRDPVTLQVHAILSDFPAGGSDMSVSARATVVDPGLETLFSRGIPELK